jgi:hypothetical protein
MSTDKLIEATATVVVELLEVASMWLHACVPVSDIEHEREQLQAKYKSKIAVHEIERVTRSGVICTRVTWKVDQ